MAEQEAISRSEERGDAPAELGEPFLSSYGTGRVVIPAEGIQPLPLPDVPITSGRLSASEMRERTLQKESDEELRKRLEALQKKTSTLGPIPRPP